MTPKLEIYKASAGSGKTYKLAYKYIAMLLGERTDDAGHIRLYTGRERQLHRGILAITFTNKATEEMKQRIVSELFCLSDCNRRSDYREDLMAATGAGAAQLGAAASEALTALLYDYGRMQISTIDAFFQKVLRSFAYEADLSGNYELTVDNRQIIEEAIADTLTLVCGMEGSTKIDAKRVGRLKRWVMQLLNNRLENSKDIRIFDKDSALRRSLSEFIHKLNNESYQSKADELERFFNAPGAMDSLIDGLEKKHAELAASVAQKASAILEMSDTAMSDTARRFLGKLSARAFDELTDTNLEYIGLEREVGALFKKSGLQKAANAPEAMRLMAELLTETRRYMTVDCMTGQMYNLGIFNEVLDVASKLKIHLNTIMLSDTNTLLHDIITDCGSDTPFIYERIGERLRHFLIDEFQDTSLLQWENLKPLIVNSLAEGYDDMIIGDVKQCIYRFRNSAPELLDTKLISDRDLRESVTLPSDGMLINWRSAVEIVDFNGELFKTIGLQKGQPPYPLPGYGSVTQRPGPRAKYGYVDILATQKAADKGFERMIAHIRRQLDSGYRPGDIAVLVRWNSDGRKVVQRLLQESEPGGRLEGVEVLSDEALYVDSARSVQYIIGQMRELDSLQRAPESVPLSGRTGLPSVTGREQSWLKEALRLACEETTDTGDSLEQVLARFDEIGHLVARTAEEDAAWRGRMRGRSVFEVVEELISRLPEPAWRVREAKYLAAFQDLVVEYCRFNAPSIHGFLELWDEKYRSEATVGLVEGINAIRVLTIHKSKGLEFDCVHVPMLEGALDREKSYRWYDTSGLAEELGLGFRLPPYFPLESSQKFTATLFAGPYQRLRRENMVDEVNTLYVAFTRAVRELVVTATVLKEPSECAGDMIHSALAANGASPGPRQDWTYISGSPTHREHNPKKDNAPHTTDMYIETYEIFDRLDTWHSTRVAPETDGGDIVIPGENT